MTPEERGALISLIDTCKDVIEAEFSPAGYNIGFNVGEAAGQTVMHCHCLFDPALPWECSGGEREGRGLTLKQGLIAHDCVKFRVNA